MIEPPSSRSRRRATDPLLRLLAINAAIGAGVAAMLTVLVIVTDTAHLRTLILTSDEPWIPVLLLLFGFLVTMCSVAMGAAIMTLPRDDDDDPPSGTREPALARVRVARG